MTSYFSS